MLHGKSQRQTTIFMLREVARAINVDWSISQAIQHSSHRGRAAAEVIVAQSVNWKGLAACNAAQ